MIVLEAQTYLDRWDARLGGGQLVHERAIHQFGIEIADALDAARAQGIVHRDSKPADICFVTTRGPPFSLGFADWEPSREPPLPRPTGIYQWVF